MVIAVIVETRHASGLGFTMRATFSAWVVRLRQTIVDARYSPLDQIDERNDDAEYGMEHETDHN